MPAHTDKEIKPNRLNFIIKDQELKKCVLIKMAIPAKLMHLSKWLKSYQSIIEYKDLEIEIVRLTGLKTETVPAVIGALGLVKKGLRKYLEKSLEKSVSMNSKRSALRE